MFLQISPLPHKFRLEIQIWTIQSYQRPAVRFLEATTKTSWLLYLAQDFFLFASFSFAPDKLPH